MAAVARASGGSLISYRTRGGEIRPPDVEGSKHGMPGIHTAPTEAPEWVDPNKQDIRDANGRRNGPRRAAAEGIRRDASI